jgi:hypothetical protein
MKDMLSSWRSIHWLFIKMLKVQEPSANLLGEAQMSQSAP